MNKFYKAILSLFLGLLPFVNCGGGSDVGTPGISGCVTYNGTPVQSAMVILGTTGSDIGTVDTINMNSKDISIIYTKKAFDTTYTDGMGKFSFQDIFPGQYVLLASKNSQYAINTIEVNQYDIKDSLSLRAPSDIRINQWQSPSTLSNKRFFYARIQGTSITTSRDSGGILKFPIAPSGEFGIFIYNVDGTYFLYDQFTTEPNCSATLIADPNRSTDYWVAKTCGYRPPKSRPYILWSSPVKNSSIDSANFSKNSNITLQFSHTMDTRLTSNAIHVFEGANEIRIDSVVWQGSDLVMARLCRVLNNECAGVTTKPGAMYYVVVDTTAKTSFGISMSIPDTVKFTIAP